MKVVGLVSGGKDSCYAMMKCIEYGHEIVALANLLPLDDSVDELNSYMYQTVGHQIVVSYAECMGLPLFRRRIHGSTRHQSLTYKTTPGDEVEDMLILLSEVKQQIPSITAVSSGAIASDYQRLRVESVCSSLGLVSLAYLWKQDQSMLLQEMISNGVAAIFVKVAAMGLDPQKHLGKDIASVHDHLLRLKELYGSNVCGEGGEYETLTLDCPLFTNARIALDAFEVFLHSPGCIAPVGVLHPSAFHLEYKNASSSVSNSRSIDVLHEKGSVFEVKGDFILNNGTKCKSQDLVFEPISIVDHDLHISKTTRNDTLSMCCWINDPCGNSQDLQKDLASILKRIESELIKDGFGWMNVLYVHLYIADMNEFSLANETYVSFITMEDCQLGVPSRSTIELPLSQVGLGKAYIEVLVANDKSKQVLHVQSISCWAPSCIGPYSQATLHKEIVYMAGQLGLDPPVMKLCCGGATAEVEKALENCQAVAENFKCFIASSTILFVVYCSASLSCSQKIEMQKNLEDFLKQRRLSDRNSNVSKLPDPMYLYVLASDLPKSALVEIKPTLYVQEDKEIEVETDSGDSTPRTLPSYSLPVHWAFEHVGCISSCCQKYVVHEKICAITVSITNEIATKICMEALGVVQNREHSVYFGTQKHMEQIARYCIYLLDNILSENIFSWGDATSLRFYFSTSLKVSQDMLSLVFSDAFKEFAELSQRLKMGMNPIFNLVPVLGAGQSAASMDDLITCELFASKL